MLTPYRRHREDCTDRAKGRNFTLCDCPIWCDGLLAGERYRRSLQTSEWTRAQRRIERLETGDTDEPITAVPARSLHQAVRLYLADAERRKLRVTTLRSYRFTFDPLTESLGKAPLADLTADRLREYQSARKVGPRTVRKEVEHLRAFFAFCLDREWIASNPAKKIKPPRIEDVATLPFTHEEITKLLLACDTLYRDDGPQYPERAKPLLLTLLYSGLRISDVAKLKRSQLDTKTGHLTLRIMKTSAPLKVLLHPDARKALATLPAYRDPTYYFRSGIGSLRSAIGSLRRTVARIGELAGVHAHPHRFRDTFAVELLSNGADIRTVQLLLGHESVRTTEKHYAHFVAAHQARLDLAASTLSFESGPARLLVVDPPKRRRRNAQ